MQLKFDTVGDNDRCGRIASSSRSRAQQQWKQQLAAVVNPEAAGGRSHVGQCSCRATQTGAGSSSSAGILTLHDPALYCRTSVCAKKTIRKDSLSDGSASAQHCGSCSTESLFMETRLLETLCCSQSKGSKTLVADATEGHQQPEESSGQTTSTPLGVGQVDRDSRTSEGA